MRAPDFWRASAGPGGRLASACLAPAGRLFAAGGWLRQRLVRQHRAALPVVCVGNLVAGGAGKTPTVLALATLLADRNPCALTRGYGGRLRGPVWVDRARHSVDDVGDEALLLARHLPTVVARSRPAGAAAAENAGAGMVIMDDGFQNPSLVKDAALLAIDTAQGFGNGRCLPAGPLREPLESGLMRADAVILLGDEPFEPANDLPLFRASIQPTDAAERWRGRSVSAFAGIGRPQKFFESLRSLGAEVVQATPFPDHHRFREGELQSLLRGLPPGATLVTTEKDHVRLPSAWRSKVERFPVALRFEEPAALTAWLTARLDAAS